MYSTLIGNKSSFSSIFMSEMVHSRVQDRWGYQERLNFLLALLENALGDEVQALRYTQRHLALSPESVEVLLMQLHLALATDEEGVLRGDAALKAITLGLSRLKASSREGKAIAGLGSGLPERAEAPLARDGHAPEHGVVRQAVHLVQVLCGRARLADEGRLDEAPFASAALHHYFIYVFSGLYPEGCILLPSRDLWVHQNGDAF